MDASLTQRWGRGVIALGSAAGCVIAAVNYFTHSSGVAGTPGALLVIASCAAILLAALALVVLAGRPRWLGRTLFALILLGILGTALAGYLLESTWLQSMMAVSFAGWLAVFLSRWFAAPATA